MAERSYEQPIKQHVREQILSHAVNLLTHHRARSAVVQLDELSEIVNYALGILQDAAIARDTAKEYREWTNLYQSRIADKRPADLKVLYLCGPGPLNDLDVLQGNGVSPHNVWAVESHEQDFAGALEQLRRSRTTLKIHHGTLSDFFEHYPDTFDLVYYDACGTFLEGKPNTLHPLLKLFEFNRLEPLAVLITNFAQIRPEKFDRVTSVLSAYFRFRYRDLPQAFWPSGLDPAKCEADGSDLLKFIKEQPEPFYSDFITRFICDLSRFWIPNCRALGFKDVADDYLARDAKHATLEAAEHIPDSFNSLHELFSKTGHMILSPSSYPLFSFFGDLRRMKPTDPLVNQLGQLKFGGQEAGRLIGFASILDKVAEGHWACLSRELLKALRSSWFDMKNHFSCDAPMPNLLINSLLGIYGRPHFPNPRQCLRLKYCAKATTMFTDALVFDQCRYYFDWLPTVQGVADRFRSRGFQILARCLMDRIGNADWSSDSHPFRYAAVASKGLDPAVMPNDFEGRKLVGPTVH